MTTLNTVTADFLLALILVAFALYALAMLLNRWAPVERSRSLLQRCAICLLTAAGGFASFVALLVSVPVAMVQWQVGVVGTVVLAGSLAFGLSVVHWAVMRRAEAVWFCDLEEQVRVNGAKATLRKEEKEPLGGDAIPTSPRSVAARPMAERKQGQVYF